MKNDLKMNRDIAEKIQQRFDERVYTVNYALSSMIGVDLVDDVFECNGFKVFLRTAGKNPENCVHAIVVEIPGVNIVLVNPNGVYIGKEFVIFDNEEGSGVVFDVATCKSKEEE